jgi:hypothetical protein
MTGTLHENQYTFMISRPILLTIRNVSDKSCTQNQDRHFVLNNNFPKVMSLMRYVEKYCRSGQATDNMMPAHCMLDTKDYKNALRIRNNYCFSAVTVVSRTRLKVTFTRTLPVLSAVKVCATHSKQCVKGLKTPVQGEDLTPETFESRRHNERSKFKSFTKPFRLKVQTYRRCK